MESSFDIAMGFVVSVLAGYIIFPLFGIKITLLNNMGIVALFTVTSLGRRYITRRFFNWLHIRKANEILRARISDMDRSRRTNS